MNNKEFQYKGHYWLIIGFISSWTGIAGIVDGIIEWHDFFSNFFKHYVYFRNIFINLLPFKIPALIGDYLVVGTGVSLIVRIVFKKIAGDEIQNSIIEHGWFKYQILVTVQILKMNWYYFTKNDNKFKELFGDTVTEMGREADINDLLPATVTSQPMFNVLLWPYTLFNYRTIFAAFYEMEKKFAIRVFSFFWGGFIVVLFLLVDFKKSFPSFFV